jgi:ribosomal protein S18 acetylase RimI-like enzyme
VSRFAIREAVLDDAEGIARVHTESWQVSYQGILPGWVLDRIDVGQRIVTRRAMLRDPSSLHLVAYDLTHGDVVGFCDAGTSRRGRTGEGEIYAIYLLHRAKRYGLGTELFERVTERLTTSGHRSLVIWVLENNAHARNFYEALGGRVGAKLHTTVAGYPVVEIAYEWSRI